MKYERICDGLTKVYKKRGYDMHFTKLHIKKHYDDNDELVFVYDEMHGVYKYHRDYHINKNGTLSQYKSYKSK